MSKTEDDGTSGPAPPHAVQGVMISSFFDFELAKRNLGALVAFRSPFHFSSLARIVFAALLTLATRKLGGLS